MDSLVEQTYTQSFAFGEQAEDHFYCLIISSINSTGLNIEEMAAVNPMRIEDYLEKNGCIVMIDGKDMISLTGTIHVEGEKLHQLLIQLAKQSSLT